MPATLAEAVKVPAWVDVTVRVTVCGPDRAPIEIDARLRSLPSIGSTPKSYSPLPCRKAAQSAEPFRYSRPGSKYFVGST